MDISIASNIVTITGNIKTIGDFQEIKTNVDALTSSYKSVVIDVVDSISIMSSVIGYFNKLILKDKIKITLRASNSKLLELLEDLNLGSLFNVTRA